MTIQDAQQELREWQGMRRNAKTRLAVWEARYKGHADYYRVRNELRQISETADREITRLKKRLYRMRRAERKAQARRDKNDGLDDTKCRG